MRGLRKLVRSLLPKAGLARSIGVLAGGTALGQLIAVVASPIVTRIYTPEDMGALAVYGSVLGLLVVVASLRYEQAIPVAESEAEATATLGLSLGLVVASSLVVLLTILLSNLLVPPSDTWKVLKPLAFLLPVGVLAVGTFQALSMWAIRLKAFPILAKTAWRQGLFGALTQIGLGLLSLGGIGLAIGQVVGQSAGVGTLARLTGTRSELEKLRGVHAADVRAVAVRFRRFPRYSSMSGLLSVASYSVPVTLMAFLIGPVFTGFYSLGLRVLQTPLRTLGNAVSQVFLSDVPEASRSGRLSQTIGPMLHKILDVGMPIAIVLTGTGASIFAVVFGSEWRTAGEYAQWLTPWLFLTMVTSPLAPLFTALEKQRAGLYFNLAFVVGRCASLILGYWWLGASTAIAMFAVISFVLQGVMLIWLASAAGLAPRTIMRSFGTALFRALPFGLPLLVTPWLHTRPYFDPLMIAYSVVAIGLAMLLKLRHR